MRTPGPWEAREVMTLVDDDSEERRFGIIIVNSSEERTLAELTRWGDFSASLVRANAAFIVQACNAHDGLLGALRSIADGPVTPFTAKSIAQSAIEKAEATA